MKRVLTNNIVANVRKQGFPKSSLDHLQDIGEERLEMLLSVLGIDPDTPTILQGCETNYLGGEVIGTFFVNAGWLAFENKIYKVAENTNLVMAAAKTIVFKIVETFTANDPVGFDDNNEFNVNQTLSIVTEVNDPGAELCDYYEALNFNKPVFSDLALINGWTGVIKIRKGWDGDVFFYFSGVDGASASAVTLCNLPIGFRPIQSLTFIASGRVSGTLRVCRVFIEIGGNIRVEDLSGAGPVDGDVSGAEFRFRAYH